MGSSDDVREWIAWLGVTTPPFGHGLSAMNLARIAVGGEDSGDRPSDSSDIGRCVRMIETAPPMLRDGMRKRLVRWARGVVRRYDERSKWHRLQRRYARFVAYALRGSR